MVPTLSLNLVLDKDRSFSCTFDIICLGFIVFQDSGFPVINLVLLNQLGQFLVLEAS